ncbi:MAG: hypothetical protein V1912_11260, partial [bacterium]
SRWVSAASVKLIDYRSMPHRVVVAGWPGAYRVEILKDSPNGAIVLRKIPCTSLEEAQAIRAATIPEGGPA